MNTGHGVFIVIEGTDGSGKGTQFKKLTERLIGEGYDVATFDFPQYDLPSSYFVREYLNGKYGSAEDVGPYTGSLFYALDRFEAAPKIRKALDEGKVVLANRFVGSNMAHQGTKFRHAEERRGYFIWLDNLEFEMLRVPRPTMSFVLRVPAEVAQKLVDQKEARSYTDKKRDIHEADLDHLKKSVEVYDDMCQLFPRDFTQVDCTRNEQLLDIDTIQQMIWQKVQPMLPVKKTKKHVAAAEVPKPPTNIVAENPYIRQTPDGTYEITKEGKQFLDDVITTSEGNVYAFTGKLDSATVAAAMARLSRQSGDMRTTLLNVPASKTNSDQAAIAGYGDDPVKQLASVHLVVGQASNLLAKKLEWSRHATCLEQPTRYMHFDQKDVNGNYRYFVPEQLSPRAKEQYKAHMDQIFNLYSEMVGTLSRHLETNSDTPKPKRDAAWLEAIRAQAREALRPVLPVSASTTVGIHASAQALEGLIVHLMSDTSDEARKAGKAMLGQARKVIPAFLAQIDDKEDSSVAYISNTRATVNKLAKEYLPEHHAGGIAIPVQMTGVWPRNELDLVPDMLYEHSNLPFKELERTVASWPYTKKMVVFEAYMGDRQSKEQRPGRALEKAHYSWDLVGDYDVFRDLQRHSMTDDLAWQDLTPRYGYDVPAVVDEVDLLEQFEACFDLSLRLYSILQEAGHSKEAQYATLFGHRMRWKVTYNAREAFYLYEQKGDRYSNPGYQKLISQMHEKLSEIHPMLGESMKFTSNKQA